jgi:class 3 adenylate cyclase
MQLPDGAGTDRNWRPSLPAFLAAMREPPSWTFDVDGFGAGIDNVHVDVHLSPRFRELAAITVRKLFAEEMATSIGQTPARLVDAEDLERFRRQYASLFEQTLERHASAQSTELLALLQLALMRCLLELVMREHRNQLEECQRAGQQSLAAGTGHSLALHEKLVLLKRHGAGINRRVLKLLFRQLRKLESGELGKLRAAVSTDAWPLPTRALFNPVLLATDPGNVDELSQDYLIAALGDGGDTTWLRLANQAVLSALVDYLPEYGRRQVVGELAPQQLSERPRERHDQGILRGFLATELLLSGFMAPEEYQEGRTCWIDEPSNLRRLMQVTDVDSGLADSSLMLAPVQWSSARWTHFRRELREHLHRRLLHAGFVERIVLCYWMPALRAQLGAAMPLALVADFCSGNLSRRRLGERLGMLEGQVERGDALRMLERCQTALRRLESDERAGYLDRFMGDFLMLRRDLKLAYKTYQAMDRLRLPESADEVTLSRANGSLWEFVGRAETLPQLRRTRAHAVVKADIRGSTRITDELVRRGLNPASHFSLNLFDPVNRLLPELGAEKLFVEGDAVILALYDYENDSGGDTSTAMPVARACGLARSILRVVAMQNILNRRHGLPELELGLGVAYSPREPHFLYDDGRRIMISAAINTADRLSACSAALRHAGVRPGGAGHRAMLAQPTGAAAAAAGGEEFLSYNVNGILLEQPAFFQLQREMLLRQTRLSVPGDDNGLYFVGRYNDLAGRRRRLAVRCARVPTWDGSRLGPSDNARRHYFEVIADESVMGALRPEFATVTAG